MPKRFAFASDHFGKKMTNGISLDSLRMVDKSCFYFAKPNDCEFSPTTGAGESKKKHDVVDQNSCRLVRNVLHGEIGSDFHK